MPVGVALPIGKLHRANVFQASMSTSSAFVHAFQGEFARAIKPAERQPDDVGQGADVDDVAAVASAQRRQHRPAQASAPAEPVAENHLTFSTARYVANVRSQMAAARKRAASPPVTTLWSNVRLNGSTRCTTGTPLTATTC